MIIDVDLPTAHDDGRFISAKVSRVVELVREYDHRLDVKWIPPNLRGDGDPAFAITEKLRDGSEVVAFYVQNEEDFDERVLARVIDSDNTQNNVGARVEAQNAAVRLMAEQRRREEVAAYADFAGSVIRSRKHTYRHEGRSFPI